MYFYGYDVFFLVKVSIQALKCSGFSQFRFISVVFGSFPEGFFRGSSTLQSENKVGLSSLKTAVSKALAPHTALHVFILYPIFFLYLVVDGHCLNSPVGLFFFYAVSCSLHIQPFAF